ncbi:protein kinase family protein [Tsukamurella soli]|uniref:Protein kinase domain-containing protein n=1 Tax=Tsukamurella soli TaxID=644556 RepID=A0ABP8KBC3_9ACTN
MPEDSPAQKRLTRLLREYETKPIDDAYLDLYSEFDQGLARAFASIHAELDKEFDFMNYKSRNGAEGHFNADNSRNLLALKDEIRKLTLALEQSGQTLVLANEYQRVLRDSEEWLTQWGGSPIPAGFTPITIDQYEAVIGLGEQAVVVAAAPSARLTLVGEGAFAHVHRYIDPTYGFPVARKKLRRNSAEEERSRFLREYEIMKGLRFPYIVEVYSFDESNYSYTMEYCEYTLEQYIKRRNNQPAFDFGARKRLTLQFLYGLNYLHYKHIFHRDLSLKNILLKAYDDEAAVVKLSDFGLAKEVDSGFTKTGDEVRGTYIDPALGGDFKDFTAVNDIWVVGVVLSYIFKGVHNLLPGTDPVGKIVQKCSQSEPSRRYQSVREVIDAVEGLNA